MFFLHRNPKEKEKYSRLNASNICSRDHVDTVNSLGLGFNRQVCGTGKCCLVVIVQCQFQRLCDAGSPRELAVASRTLLRVCWKLGLGGRMGRPVVRLTLVTFLLLIVGKTSAGSLSNIPLTPDFALSLT